MTDTGESSVTGVVTPRASEVGGLPVRRVLPAAHCRAVGPFVFLDQIGPVHLEPGSGLDVPPHPHIGLSTLTYLFAGELLHRDSLGIAQPIRPGELNWMTAGRGIVHSERTPADLRQREHELFGLQAWAALPREHEEIEPDFAHHGEEELPLLETPGVALRIVAGSWGSASSPARGRSPLVLADARIAAGASWEVTDEHPERGLYVVSGEIEIEDQIHAEGGLLILRTGRSVTLRAKRPARLALLGGAPLDGHRTVFWNFVSSSRERIQRAAEDWRARRFPAVPGDDGYVPLPS